MAMEANDEAALSDSGGLNPVDAVHSIAPLLDQLTNAIAVRDLENR